MEVILGSQTEYHLSSSQLLILSTSPIRKRANRNTHIGSHMTHMVRDSGGCGGVLHLWISFELQRNVEKVGDPRSEIK
ncbi:hypothetical protein DY000_02018055 [Brassica cretica]|uniref:Uncharacterized protein n=1 Tax=Brassica cretica TaxID=69181 RepID=A0ABQ7CY07_BRACR|nr:hypothetical protein DY000_02018055 [Brassica cretica]